MRCSHVSPDPDLLLTDQKSKADRLDQMPKTPQPEKKKTSRKKKTETEKTKKKQIEQTSGTVTEQAIIKEEPAPKDKKGTDKTEKKKRPLYLRILKQLAKTLFIRIPLILIVIIAAALLFAKIYLSPSTVENLAKESFNGMSYGTLELNVEDFSPYSGFAINNIVIKSGPDFNKQKLFEMERIVFRYGFFSIFTGSIRFPEIGLYKPRVYLTEKNGIWNAATLMKPSEKKPEPEEEEEEEEPSEPSTGDINLPISVDFLFNFILDDLCVYVRGTDMKADMTGLTFKALIDVPPFKTIPRSVEAVRLLKTMKFELNPEKSMDVKFYSKAAATEPELILNWKLAFSNGDTPEFSSTLNAGARRMPLRLQNKFLSPFNFLISYDIFYNPINDILKLNSFSVSFQNSRWLSLSGKVSGVTKNQVLDIKMDESRIPLKDLYPYYVVMTGDRTMRWNGEVSLAPLSVRGTAKAPEIKGAINIKNLFFKNPGIEARVPLLSLGYFMNQYGSSMDLGADIAIPHLRYIIEGSKSGDNGIKLSARASGINNFSKVKINEVSLDFYNPSGREKALSMNLAGLISMGKAMSGNINIDRLQINTRPLQFMVPGRFKKQVEGIPLKKPVDLKLGTDFTLAGQKTAADLALFAKIPDYGVNDLALKASVEQDAAAQRVRINKVTLGSRAMNLLLAVNGTVDLKKAPLSDSDLRVSLELNNSALKSIFGPWKTSGVMKLSARMKGDLDTGKAWGNLVFSDFNVRNDEDMLALNDLDMNFPFEYEFKARKGGKSYIAVNQKEVIDSEQFGDKANFTIKSVSAKHPARDISYEYMKDFTASMVFRDNVFRISNLKASVMDGSIYGRSILFNLADFKPENMEFNLILDVSNINVARLDDPDPRKGGKEAELSLNANFSGRGLNIQKELTASGYINIYKIGTEFANRLMRGLSEEQGKSKLGGPVQFAVDNSMLIKGFDFRLDKGLVYTTVTFTRKALSLLFTVDNSQVSFERIPIQEYLRKVSEAK